MQAGIHNKSFLFLNRIPFPVLVFLGGIERKQLPPIYSYKMAMTLAQATDKNAFGI